MTRFRGHGKRAAPGIEPGTSRTRSENHATRPSSQLEACCSVFASISVAVVQILFSDWVLKRERCLANVEHAVFAVMSEFRHHKTTPVGFEPTRGDPIGLAGRHLNRSAKVSLLKLAVERTTLPLPGDRMLWLDAPDTYVHLAIPLFRGAPNLACQPQLGEQNFQIFNNMNAPLAQWLKRWSYEP